MHIPDLDAYNYGLPFALPNVLAVGWLNWTHLYPLGEMAPALLDTLKLLATTQPANQMRGTSACELCGARNIWLDFRGARRLLGSAEVWIPHRADGSRIFAAPDLIVHYVEEHDYLPPEAFLEALTGVDLARWNGTLEAERIVDAAFVGR